MYFVKGPSAMAKDPLAEAGFYFDELNKLRVLEPDVSQKTSELKEECKEFVDSKHGRFLSNPFHHNHFLPPLSAVGKCVWICMVFSRNWPVSEDSWRSYWTGWWTGKRSRDRKDEGKHWYLQLLFIGYCWSCRTRMPKLWSTQTSWTLVLTLFSGILYSMLLYLLMRARERPYK